MNFLALIVSLVSGLVVLIAFLPMASGIIAEMNFGPSVMLAVNTLILVLVVAFMYGIVAHLNDPDIGQYQMKGGVV